MLNDNILYNEVIQKLKEPIKRKLKQLNITILRNIIVEPILDVYIKYLLLQEGFRANISLGAYDNIIQDSLKNDELLNINTNYVLVFLNIEILSNILGREYFSYNNKQIQDEKDRIVNYIKCIIKGIRNQTNAVILWCNFEVPIYSQGGIADSQSNSNQIGDISDLNRSLQSILNNTDNAYNIDINLCIARMGYENFYDRRYWYIGRAPYGNEACKELSFELFKYMKSLLGKVKKCLVLDCDNVLWGGILGEQGIENINLGKQYPGCIYQDYQLEILNLYNRGIILAICSKNNEKDVWEVFNMHPDMVLKRKHISAYKINWNNKVVNLQEIACQLNIDLESIVFVDDCMFEIDLVNQMLPQVATIFFDKNKAYSNRDILASCGYFDTLFYADLDKNRTKMYQTDIKRKKYIKQFDNIDRYYKSLEMIVSIEYVDSFSVPRVAQLTQRTNQFNLTTKRYSNNDIKKMMGSKEWEILCMKIHDRFGDLGIVGVCILQYKKDCTIIDSFMLSCRAIGRKAENILLNNIIKLSAKNNKKIVIGEYYPTEKNKSFKDFYTLHGFLFDNNTKKNILDIKEYYFEEPYYFKDINSVIN